MTDLQYVEAVNAIANNLTLARVGAMLLYNDLRADGHGNAVTRHAHACRESIVIAQGELKLLTTILPPVTTK